MKTILILLLLVFQNFSSSANISDILPAHAAFRKNFSTAEDVHWENSSPFQRVSFRLDNQVMEAVYNSKGELVSLLRHITSDHLPLLLGMRAKKMLNDHWITALTEVETQSDHFYILVVQNSENELIFKSSEERRWKLLANRKK